MKTQAIIPTAGLGTRLSPDLPKPLLVLNKKPLFVYALETVAQSFLIESVILVVHKDYKIEFERIVRERGLLKVSKIVAGGQTRCESVYNGFSAIDEDTEVVMVHDGVRPLATRKLIDESIQLCQSYDAVIAAVRMKSTIKRINQQNLIVEETLNRDQIWEVQTPQVFKKEILKKAYEKNRNNHFTDEASLVEQIGVKVKVLESDYRNIKVTTQEDLIVAEALLNQSFTGKSRV